MCSEENSCSVPENMQISRGVLKALLNGGLSFWATLHSDRSMSSPMFRRCRHEMSTLREH